MNENNNSYYSSLSGVRKAVPILLAALAVFVGVCLFGGGGGALGTAVPDLLFGLLSLGAYLIPVALLVHAICYAEDVALKKVGSRTLFSLITIISASAVEYAISFWDKELTFAPTAFYEAGTNGGFIGSVIGFAIGKLIGSVGVIILIAAILAIYATFFYADKTGSFGRRVLAFKAALGKRYDGIKAKFKAASDKNKKRKEEEAQFQREQVSDELADDDFFKSKDGADVKVSKLGIDESATPTGAAHLLPQDDEEEVIPEEPVEEKPKKAHKPLDLNYGIEDTDITYRTTAEPPIASTSDVGDKKYDNKFFGLDDSPENVFTQDFEPFNFATSERLASKPSSKAIVQEEIDEWTMAEMKGEPTAKEKRMMQLEQKKKEWLAKKERENAASGATNPSPAPVAAPVTAPAPTPTVDPAPVVESTTVTTPVSAPVPTSPAVEPAPVVTPVPSPAPAPRAESAPLDTGSSIPAGVNTYTSYSTTKTTYTSPVTVEFTITNDPKPTYNAPQSAPVSARHEETAEEVADIIAQKIAKRNPAYARSANEMKTYTRVISSGEDELYQPKSEPIAAPVNDEFTIEFAEDKPEAASNIPTYYEFTDDNAAAPITQPAGSPYARAAGFAEALTATAAPEFKPYGTPTAATATPASEPSTIKVEREMLTPTHSTRMAAEAPAPEIAVSDGTPATVTGSAPAPTASDYAPKAAEYTPATTDYTPKAAEYTPASADYAPKAAEYTPAAVEYTPAEPTLDASEPKYTASTAADSDFEWTADDSGADSVSLEENFDGIELAADDNGSDFVSFEEEPDEIELIAEEDDLDPEEAEEITPPIEIPEDESDDDLDLDEIPPEEQNPDVIKMREMFPFLDPLDKQKPVEEKPEETAEDDASPFDDPIVKRSAPIKESLAPVPAKPEPKKPDYSDYVFPPLDLLAKDDESNDENAQEESQESANKLIDTLASFNVSASIKGVDRGPRVTRYEVVPSKGVKVSSILNLQDDLALNLAADSLRMEAPIPGKSAVGIEIPNKKSTIVRLRNLLECEEFVSSKSKTAVCIGRDISGHPVCGDIANMPHLLIAGATGMGKSVCINALIISILYKARPDEVKFIMIDPKQVEFTMYNGIPHLLVPVVSDAKQAAGALMWAVEEMERRYNLLNPLCVRNVDAYNEKVTRDRSLGEPLPRIIIVIDEFADLMLQVKNPVEGLVTRIAQKARAAGIYLVIGTQRPSVDVITGVIKANVPTRMSCKVMSAVDSKTVLDSTGAEKLLNKGDMLYAPNGSSRPSRVQGAFVSDGEVEAIMEHLKQFGNGANYDSSVMEEIDRAAQKCSKKGSGDFDDGDGESYGDGYLNDKQFLDAVDIAVNTKRISTSLIQRKLSIGYSKAAKFIDIMEDLGVVGEPNGQRAREVLMTPDQWREKLARSSIDD